ncbi:MAG TPA: carbohydrate ABC transporter permease [Chloroflexota bacterium]|jgi:multiple sugar transport system permease protein|nr:carbohydrate ABC transporter permease [Chloroflexota bacterium]
MAVHDATSRVRPAAPIPRARVRPALGDAAMYLFVLVTGVTMFGPIVWMLLAAFKRQEEIITLPPALLPSEWMWQNFLTVVEQSPIGRAYLNSLIIATTVTAAQVLTSTIGGYAFTKLRFPGREPLFIGLLTTMMIPAFLIQIPLFVMVNAIGWLNTYQALIVPSLFTAFGLFMMRQYMLNLPQEIVDAARIDGARELGIIFGIALPLVREAAAALAIFAFIFHWDQLFWPLLVARQQHIYTVPLALLYMLGQYGNYEHLQMAGATLAILPPLIVFFVMQDKIVRGVTMTGLKG